MFLWRPQLPPEITYSKVLTKIVMKTKLIALIVAGFALVSFTVISRVPAALKASQHQDEQPVRQLGLSSSDPGSF